ncbi:MAG: fibrobacter succinogenes major paralogous domain-containing protein [Bacteroidetes bacterium]|nr:fibrobacter succinogenes major paralogous domain-containing protein [Bacteroidota bacterium]
MKTEKNETLKIVHRKNNYFFVLVVLLGMTGCIISAGTHGSLKGYDYEISKYELEKIIHYVIDENPKIHRGDSIEYSDFHHDSVLNYYNDRINYITIGIETDKGKNSYTFRYYGDTVYWNNSKTSRIFICYAYDEFGNGGSEGNGGFRFKEKTLEYVLEIFEKELVNKVNEKLNNKENTIDTTIVAIQPVVKQNNSTQHEQKPVEKNSNPTPIDLSKLVEINGVQWATCNVDAPGTFATKPEAPGMLYQWNRKKGWAATDNVTGWDATIPGANGNSWEKANDPCPSGWRVPTREEIETLLDEDKMSNEWTTVNGVDGRRFTDKATGNSIFLPAVGSRRGKSGTFSATCSCGSVLDYIYTCSCGFYWSSTLNRKYSYISGPQAYYLSIDSDSVRSYGSRRTPGCSVRCVVE